MGGGGVGCGLRVGEWYFLEAANARARNFGCARGNLGAVADAPASSPDVEPMLSLPYHGVRGSETHLIYRCLKASLARAARQSRQDLARSET